MLTASYFLFFSLPFVEPVKILNCWRLKIIFKVLPWLVCLECVNYVAGIESCLWFSFYFRIHGLPNTDSLILSVSLLWLLFTSKFVLQWATLSDFPLLCKGCLPHWIDRSFRKGAPETYHFSFSNTWILMSSYIIK